jgi:hypothetical protein
MKLLIFNMLILCMIVSISPFAEGAPLSAESCRPATCATGQSQVPLSLAEANLDDLHIILAGVERDQCWGKCDGDRRSCVDSCPGWEEDNVVDPKYAARKCRNVCDTVLSQCKSKCPN